MANNIDVKDANDLARTLWTRDNTGVHLTGHAVVSEDGSEVAPVTSEHGLGVQVKQSVLPTGAATAAKQDELATLIGEVDESPSSNTLLARLKDLLTGIVLAPGANAIGAVTANAGTNLNTSALALEEGGNLATVAGAVSNGAMQVAGSVSITDISAGEYETVAAEQTEQALGATGGAGDYLAGLLIVPASTDPGAVAIKDGSGPAITVFEGGEGSVSNLVPFFVPLGIKSTDGAWQVTTGEDVSVVASGNFT